MKNKADHGELKHLSLVEHLQIPSSTSYRLPGLRETAQRATYVMFTPKTQITDCPKISKGDYCGTFCCDKPSLSGKDHMK